MRRAIALAALLAAAPAAAEVTSASPAGFESVNIVTVPVAPDAAYAALLRVGAWWNGSHSYSGDAANLTLDAKAGGCFCERWAGNAVEHMRVVAVRPGAMLRLSGGLGPLQGEGVAGALTWSLKAASGGTEITQTYVVGGHVRGGMEAIAAPVDAVLAEQLERLRAHLAARR